MLTQPERQAVFLLAGVIVLFLALYLGTAVLLPEGGAIAYSDNVSGVAVVVPGGWSKLTLSIGDTVTLRGTVSTYSGNKDTIVRALV